MSYLSPQAEQQAIRKAIKATVRLASTANIDLGDFVTTVDGVRLVDQDRVLVKNQTRPQDNGIYVWSIETQFLTRARDFLTDFAVGSGMVVLVREGNTYQESQWQLIAYDLPLGTAPLRFERIAGRGAILTQLQMFLVGADVVDGETASKVSCQFAFNPNDWPPGKQFFFGAILSVNDTLRAGAVELHNLSDAELVRTGTLSTSSLIPVKQESSALRVGMEEGDLKATEKLYEVRILNDGTLTTEKTFLGCAYIRLAD